MNKNGFKEVVLGLSGGIDSALVACIAHDALGADRVRVLIMPSMYSSEATQSDAEMMAENLGIRYDYIAISDVFDSYITSLDEMSSPGPSRAWPRRTCRRASAAIC